MSRAHSFVIVAFVVGASLAAGCSSAASEEPSVAGPVVLRGVFRPTTGTSSTAISELEFRDTHYRLQTQECKALGCEEQGTFALDRAHDLLTLVVDTGRSYSMHFAVLATRKPAEGDAAKSTTTAASQARLRPADLVGSGQTATGEPAPLLVETGVQLIEQADVDGQTYSLFEEDTDQCDNSGSWPRVWEGQLCGGTGKTFGYAHCYVKTTGCGSSGRSCLDDMANGGRWDERASECGKLGGRGMESQGSGIYVAFACCKPR